MKLPWPAGSATGIGSMPGTEPTEAIRFVLGELPELAFLPELPARGPGAEMIGRTGAFLVELPLELYSGQWRVASHAGRDLRRTKDLLERDLDALADLGTGFGGTFKLQAAGPWTLAASVDRQLGGPMLGDPGAVRDLVASLAEGLAAHLADVARRLPAATLLLQLDEPSLPAVLAGRIPTESGLRTLRAIDAGTVRDALRSIVDFVGVPVVLHCCASRVPVGLFVEAGAAAVSLDLSLVDDLDPIGEAVEAGAGLFAGVAPTVVPSSGRAPSSAAIADAVRTPWHKLGFGADRLAAQVVVTPTCGLASASPGYAQAVLKACREAGRRLADDAEG